jgi:hypothetical protein
MDKLRLRKRQLRDAVGRRAPEHDGADRHGITPICGRLNLIWIKRRTLPMRAPPNMLILTVNKRGRMSVKLLGSWLLSALLALAGSVPATAAVEKIVVHGRSLEGNLEGNSADRTVYVLTPPSYGTAKARRYPVVYFLHGYLTKAEQIIDDVQLPKRYDAAMVATGHEFIVVVPDTYTRHGGSMYSDSATVGNFETFIA